MSAALSLDGIHFDHDGHPVLSGLDLSVDDGQVLALLGPSGCGKSTVLRLILGLAVPARGSVSIGGAVASEADRLLVPPEARGLAVVFQDLALWPHLTVHGNLSFGLRARGVSATDRAPRIASMLDCLGLADKASRYPGELSGGERQRVAIARALVLEPRAVLLDEPLSDLDTTLKRELLSLFHDLREAATLGDRIAVMESGRVVQVGTFDDLRAKPASPFVQGLLESL